MEINVEILTRSIISLISSILIILIGFIIGRFIGKILYKFLHDLEIDRILNNKGFNFSVEENLSSLIKYLVYLLFIIIGLNQLGLTKLIFNIIIAIIILVIFIFLGISLKGFLPNYIAGLFFHRKNKINIGDYIKFKDIEGKIIKITLTDTQIKRTNGDIIFIPNILLMKSKLLKK